MRVFWPNSQTCSGWPLEIEKFWGRMSSSCLPAAGIMGSWGLTDSLDPHLFMGRAGPERDWDVPGPPGQGHSWAQPTIPHPWPSLQCPFTPHCVIWRSQGDSSLFPLEAQPEQGAPACRPTSCPPPRLGSPRWPAGASAGAGSCTRPDPAPGPRHSGSAAPAPQGCED